MRSVEAIQPVTIGTQVYERIKNSIVRGEILPGQKLSDVELSGQLKVSRSPIREAIHKLAHDGLVDLIPHKGAFVVQITSRQVEQLFDVRESLEGLACRLACLHAPQAELRSVRCSLEQAERKVKSGLLKEYPQEEVDFHMTVTLWGKNLELQKILQAVHRKILLVRYRSGALENRAPDALAEHLAILDSIESRDPRRAEERMRDHIRKARASILRLFSDTAGAIPRKTKTH